VTLFLVFLLGYMLSQFFRAFLAVIAPELAVELGLDAHQLANISAVFFLVFALAQFPLGVALDRIGPRRTVPVLMLVASLGAALLANARTGFECILANGLIGLGCSPIYMGALYVFARTAPADRFGYLCSCLIGLGTLGNLAAATPLALVAQQFGWRSAFYGIAVLTLVSALLNWIFITDPPRVTKPDSNTPGAKRSGSAFTELWQILKIPALWPLMPLAALAYGCVAVERGLWIGPYFSGVHGLEPLPRGNAVLIMAAAMSIGALVFGALDRSPGRRTPLIMAGALATALGFLALGLLDQPSVWLAVATLGVVGWAGLHLPLLTAQARTYYPEHLIGRGITFFNFLTIGGAGLVQWISGIYVDQLQTSGLPAAAVYSKLHLAFGLTILASALIYCVFGPRLRPPS
jgi:sugar phosphate permease